jgi:hypothetical protein
MQKCDVDSVIKVKGAKRHQAHKMPEALGSRLGAHPNEQWQYAIN